MAGVGEVLAILSVIQAVKNNDPQQVAKVISGFIGLVEKNEGKIALLLESDFKAGMNVFEQAKHSSNERESLLREARVFFNRAIAIEEKNKNTTRLAEAYFGLSMCHRLLNDLTNADMCLRKVLEISSGGGIFSLWGGDKKLQEMQEDIYKYFKERSPTILSQMYNEKVKSLQSVVSQRINAVEAIRQRAKSIISQFQAGRSFLEKTFQEKSNTLSQDIKNTLGRLRGKIDSNLRLATFEAGLMGAIEQAEEEFSEKIVTLQKEIESSRKKMRAELRKSFNDIREKTSPLQPSIALDSKEVKILADSLKSQIDVLQRRLDTMLSITPTLAKEVSFLIKTFEDVTEREFEVLVQDFKQTTQVNSSASTKEQMEKFVDSYEEMISSLEDKAKDFSSALEEMSRILRNLGSTPWF